MRSLRPVSVPSRLSLFLLAGAKGNVPFNEAIWKGVKGADTGMPPPVNAAFVRVSGRSAE